jgi:non-canonical purine NTP pyrophosphatase (RdgB/HAM1 family)
MAMKPDSRNMFRKVTVMTPWPRLVVATHNQGKLREFRDLLAPYVDVVTSAGELGLPEPEETGMTFAENALLKARAAAQLSNSVALADDSGLCVTALEDAPGIYSARWAGPGKDFSVAMQRVHTELGSAKDRSAHFICVLALAWPDGTTETIEGRVDGHMVWPPRGHKGHGYDPVFVPQGESRTFAEMNEEEKNAISHRGLAVQKFIAQFLSRT